MAVLDSIINVALLLFILVVLVVVHEFGHFVTARLAGVRVHEFGIGFPPRARIFARDHETIYTLNWLPIGGFVRLEGEEGESTDPRSFVRQRLPVRLIILLAGVVMNLLLAWLIFSFIAGAADPTATVRIGFVQPGSPAAAVGLRGGQPTGTNEAGVTSYDSSGDRIVAIDGGRFPLFDGPDASIEYLRQRAGRMVTLTIQSADGAVRDVQVTLRSPEEVAQERGALGIGAFGFEPGENLRRDPAAALAKGAERTGAASVLILNGLRDLLSNLANPQVSGPIGIARAVGTVRTEAPPIVLLYLVGILSANLAVVNVLPFPPMDGGRIAMNLLQAVTGNRISVALERATYLVGFVLLMAFLIWISYFDIQRTGLGT